MLRGMIVTPDLLDGTEHTVVASVHGSEFSSDPTVIRPHLLPTLSVAASKDACMMTYQQTLR